MTLLFCDGFDHVAVGDVTSKYNLVSLSGASIVTGRLSGNCLKIINNATLQKSFTATASFIVGFAMKLDLLPTSVVNLITVKDGAVIHNGVAMLPSGQLFVWKGTNATILTSVAPGPYLQASTWYYLEFKVTIADSIGAGTCKIAIDGVDALVVNTAQDTRNAGNDTCDSVIVSGPVLFTYIDDLYIDNGTAFLGDCKVQTFFPTGNGNANNFVGSDSNSTDNYLLVDEATPATADYVESATPNDVDLYNFDAISPAPTTIHGVQTNAYIERTDTGARTFADVCRSSGTNYPGDTKTPSGGSYNYQTQMRTANPAGGAWDATGFNAAEFGVKVIA